VIDTHQRVDAVIAAFARGEVVVVTNRRGDTIDDGTARMRTASQWSGAVFSQNLTDGTRMPWNATA
jgi:hypothetical protein